MPSFKIVSALIKFSLMVGVAGGLVDLTWSLMYKAAIAQQHGLVSLRSLNQQLYGGTKKER